MCETPSACKLWMMLNAKSDGARVYSNRLDGAPGTQLNARCLSRMEVDIALEWSWTSTASSMCGW